MDIKVTKQFSLPLVSVIINCFNGEEYLRECVDSVIAQSYPNWELIFIDNNSSDSSAEIINSYRGNINYYKLEKTIPLYSARNFGIDKAKGSFIAFLDCDDFWAKNKLEIQVEMLVKGYDLVFSSYDIVDAFSQRSKIPVFVGEGVMISPNLLLKKNLISISTVLVKTDVIKQNKFNPEFNLIGDLDLWIRLSLKYKFYSMNQCLQFNREHGKNLSNTLFTSWILEKRKFVLANFSDLVRSCNFYILLYTMKAEVKNIFYVVKKVFKK